MRFQLVNLAALLVSSGDDTTFDGLVSLFFEEHARVEDPLKFFSSEISLMDGFKRVTAVELMQFGKRSFLATLLEVFHPCLHGELGHHTMSNKDAVGVFAFFWVNGMTPVVFMAAVLS